MTERLRKSDWEVRDLDIALAEHLVSRHHYARGASNTAVYIHGLWRVGAFWSGDCLGVAWWLPPTKAAAVALAGERWQGVLSLSRLVILPDVPKNAASFLVARSRRLIDRTAWPVLVTYADSWRGHTGAIYRADNWRYDGLTKPQACYTLNGRMIARKAGPRSRTHAEMLQLGAVFEGRFSKHRYVRDWSEAA